MQSTTKPRVTVSDPTTPSQQLAVDSSGRATVNVVAPVPVTDNAGSLTVDGSVSISGTVTTARTGAANMANGQVTTSNVAGTLVAARATRRYVTIKNLDASITVYIGIATVTSANGLPLLAGESVSLDFVGLIQVIAASATPTVAYVEVYD